MAQGFTRALTVDIDGTLTANSNFLVPSEAAVITYISQYAPSIKINTGRLVAADATVSTVFVVGKNQGGECTVATFANTATLATANTATIDFVFDVNLIATANIRAVVESAGGALTGLAFGTYDSGLAERMRLRADGRFGIGIHSPNNSLHICSQPTFATGGITLEQASGDTVGPILTINKERGSIDTPTQPTSGDDLGSIIFGGYGTGGGDSSNLDSRVYVQSAQIKATSTGTIAATRIASTLAFLTGTNAAPTVLTEAMRIDETQKVGIGTTAPASLFSIGGDANGGQAGIRTATELLTVAAAGTSVTVGNLLPAGAMVLAVSCRVTTVIPTATSFTLKSTTDNVVFTGAVSVAGGSTDPGTTHWAATTSKLSTAAQTITLTITGSTPANNSGRVRITVYYWLPTPPTS